MDRQKAVTQITTSTGMDEHDAYAMLLLTAALMDLHPDDDEVVAMILQDCGGDG